MKKHLLFVLLVFLQGISWCYAQDKKVAIVTFYANKQIGVDGFASPAATATMMRLAADPAFDMAAIVKSFHDQFYKYYSGAFPFSLLPEDQVIGNGAYQAFVPTSDPASASAGMDVAVKGYKVILPSKDNEKALLDIFNDCDGIMKIYIDFDLRKKGLGGVALVKVDAQVHIVIYNKRGKKIFDAHEDALSQISGTQVVGVPFFTPDKILPLCENAVDELLIKLKQEMPRIAKKAEGKI